MEDWDRVSVIAHSFGTYILARILEEQHDIHFDRVILCGSIVREDYPWHLRIKCRQVNELVNDAGQRDIWPILAKVLTWGYGATGTFGIGQAEKYLKGDRIHRSLGHSAFLTPAFAEKYWVPFLQRGEVVPEADPPSQPPWWKSIATVVQPKYVILVFLLSLMLLLSVARLSELMSGRSKWDCQFEFRSVRFEQKGTIQRSKTVSIYENKTGRPESILYGPYVGWGSVQWFKVRARLIREGDLDRILSQVSETIPDPDVSSGADMNEWAEGIFRFGLSKGTSLGEPEWERPTDVTPIIEELQTRISIGPVPRIQSLDPGEDGLVLVLVEFSAEQDVKETEHTGSMPKYKIYRSTQLITTDESRSVDKPSIAFYPPGEEPNRLFVGAKEDFILAEQPQMDREREYRLHWKWKK